MTEPIKSACGNFYAGMTKSEADSLKLDPKKIVIDFNQIDVNNDKNLSEEEILAARKLAAGKKQELAEIIGGLGISGIAAGVYIVATTLGVATAPAWAPIAGAALILGGGCAWIGSNKPKTQATNIEKETQQYLEQKKDN